jgi:hypothetical protein
VNVVPSVIRTGVPVLVGVLVSLATSKGVHVSAELESQLVVLVGALAGSLYHWVVRLLEERWPRFGWLLGMARAPRYGEASGNSMDYVSTTKYDDQGQITEITTVYKPRWEHEDEETT